MNVYLIKTPEYDYDELLEIGELLNSFEGPVQFFVKECTFSEDEFPFLRYYWDEYRFPGFISDVEKTVFDQELGHPLSWRELFSLCNRFRATGRIAEDDFVVLVTRRKNALNWFSHFDQQRNIFVHAGDWEYYLKASHRFPVAYQVVENILQYLMRLDTEEYPNPYIHLEPLGCMNDYCGKKSQVILKLRTGDICPACLDKMRAEAVDDSIINQGIGVFEYIREQLLFKQGFTRNIKPSPVQIGANGQVFIGGQEMNLNPLESTLFIFFIGHQEGVRLDDLHEHRDTLFDIYRTIRPAAERQRIVDLTRPYHQTGTTFSVNKSRLNKSLREQLGVPIANFYFLEGSKGEPFRINLSPDYVTSDIRY